MHLFNALSFISLLPILTTAHNSDIPGAPRIFGRRAAIDLRSRGLRLPDVRRHVANVDSQIRSPFLDKRKRQNTSGQCGSGFGSCAPGYCCSAAGWCGQGDSYCAAPDCQFNYGPACDANTTPPGTNTSTVARTKLGSVAYGGNGIFDCTVNGMIALTFDDGPYIYTNDMLDILDKYNVKATFFITGNNLGKGEIDNAANPWPAIIQRMYNSGHQIASHTWSHQDLSTEVTHVQRLDQMYKNEMALRNILQVFPTYMRPPYSSCTSASGCQADMKTLGYHVTYFDLDTEDYLNDSPNMIQTSKNDFKGNISTNTPSDGNWLAIGHDIHEQTAHNLTEYMITTGLAAGWKFGTVGQCLGDPQSNWYRSSSGSLFTSSSSAAPSSTTTKAATSTSASPVAPTSVSDDATCGGSTGKTCLNSGFGNCCSVNGYCGSTSAYCGTGCQAGFGNCGSNNASSSASATSSGAAPTSTLTASPDGSCSGSTGYTCAGSSYGNCCSAHGYCGSTSDYCDAGCQLGFGSCGVSSSSSTLSSLTTVSTSAVASPPTTSSAGTSSTSSSSSTTTVVSTVTLVPVPVSTVTTSTSKSSSSFLTTSSSSAASSTATSSLVSSQQSSSTSSSASSASSILVPSTPSTTRTSTTSITTTSVASSTTGLPSSSSSTTSPSTSSSSRSSSSVTSTPSSISSTLITSTSTSSKPPTATIATTTSKSLSTSTLSTSTKLSSTSKTTSSVKAAATPKLSTNGQCGADMGMTCAGFLLNNCCGADGYCGAGLACMRLFGCQDAFSTLCI